MNALPAILFAVVLLAINAFFVSAEFALISSRRDRLDALIAQGKTRARTVLYATEHLSMMLAGAQLGITIASLLLGKVGEPAIALMIEAPFHAAGMPDNLLHPVSFAIALALVTVLHIILGEMVPKNIALAGPESVAMLLVPTHMWFVRITRPLIVLMNWMARVTLRMFGIEQKEELDSTVDRQQLATMIRESRSEGLLDAEEHARLNKALGTESRLMKEVLIPRGQVHTLTLTRDGIAVDELEQAVSSTGFSRFPVIGVGGEYAGYIHVKDVLDDLVNHSDASSEASTITPVFLPRSSLRRLISVDGSTTLDAAMRLMRRRSAHMAEVRERGQLLGIVTLEDLIEEYVGTVRDWTHEEEP